MKILAIGMLLLLGPLREALAQEPRPVVRLFSHDRQIALIDRLQQELLQQTLELVKSSNFNSSFDKRSIFTFDRVQQDYRDTVSTHEYLLATLSLAKTIETLGGAVTVKQIVVGLQGGGGQNRVFTIDETGRIVSHAKYEGTLLLGLKNAVESARR